MKSEEFEALENALALHAYPGRLRTYRMRALPENVLLLIRIAAGDPAALATADRRTGQGALVIIDAARLYIQQVMFFESADSYRILGVRPEVEYEGIKESYRWLMHWLHPDRNPERWEVAFSDRINAAWTSLNSPARRAEYDRQLQVRRIIEGAPDAFSEREESGPRLTLQTLRRPLMSARTVRVLPFMILGGMALVSTVGLLVFSWTQVARGPEQDVQLPAPPGDSVAAGAGRPSRGSPHPAARAMLPEMKTVPLAVSAGSGDIPRQTAVSEPGRSDGAIQPISAESSARQVDPVGAQSARNSPLQALAEPSRRPEAPTSRGLPVLQESRSSTSGVASIGATVEATADPETGSAIKTVYAINGEQSLRASDAPNQPAPPAATRKGSAEDSSVVSASPAEISPARASVSLPLLYISAYERGDVTEMMNLFASDARENNDRLDAMRRHYQQFFTGSSRRVLRFNWSNWTVAPDRIEGTGEYSAQIQSNDDPVARSVSGRIQVQAVAVDGAWKIRSLNYGTGE